ncbi:MAG: ribonuclease Z [Bacteroidales bacterium]|nr:ribonuclease Z [Bacteroidales bacterium]
MSSFQLTILGSSSALPTSERFPTAHLLNANERFFLIDCGEGTQMQLRKFRIKLGKINHIFISHLHGDHILGLFGLISSFSLLGRTSNLHIYGTDMLEELILDHLKYFQGELSYHIAFHKIQTRRSALIYQDSKTEVHTIPLKHRVPTCGFLIKEKSGTRNIKKEMIEEHNISIRDIVSIKEGSDYTTPDGRVIPNEELTLPAFRPRSYAYCSDTAYHEQIIDHVKNVDLMYHETTFLHEDLKLAVETTHSTSRQAAELAGKAGVGKLLIGHFSSRYKHLEIFEQEARAVFPESYAVNDGDVFVVEQQRES